MHKINTYNDDIYISCRLWFSLKYFGHRKVSVLDGGMKKWLKENKITTNKISKVEPKNCYKVNENIDWIIRKKQIDDINKKMDASLSSGDLKGVKELIEKLDIKCPVSGTNNWTNVRQFHLMFKT